MVSSLIKKHFSGEQEEILALSGYMAATNGFKDYGSRLRLEISNVENNNVHAEMCLKRLSNLAYGCDYRFTIGHGENLYGMLFTRVEAFHSSYQRFGNLELRIDGTHDIVRLVVDGFNSAEPQSKEEIENLIKDFNKGKQFCYGLCKRDR